MHPDARRRIRVAMSDELVMGRSDTDGREERPVAIVDDDPAVLDSLRFLLEVAGHKVAVFPSGEAYLDQIAFRAACLILDHHMPRMTGLELAARLRERECSPPMLLITGSPTAAIRARAQELGIEKVVEKPVPEDELLRFVAGHY